MRWRARKQPGPADGSAAGAAAGAAEGVVARRAVVVPLEAENKLGNENNLSPDARVPTRLVVVVRPEGSADGGGDDGCGDGGGGGGGAAAQTVAARVPNWLTVVLCYAGSNHGPSADLPAEVEVGVQVDPHTGVVVGVDVDAAVTDLAPYREVATRWWKETDAPLADLRGLAALPGDAVRGVRGMASAWRRAVSDLRDDARASGPPTAAHGEAEAEQLRRTSATVRHRLQGNPKQLAKIRASALEAGPMMVANVRAGSMSVTDLESWLTFQVGSGAVTEAEAADWRAAAAGG